MPADTPPDTGSRRAPPPERKAGWDDGQAPLPKDATRQAPAGRDAPAKAINGWDDSSAPGPEKTPESTDTADQFRELARPEAQRLRSDAIDAEKTVTPTLQEVAAQNGGTLVGLKHRIKEEDSLTTNLAKDAATRPEAADHPEQAVRAEADETSDTLRYTVQAEPEQYVSAYEGIKNDLAARGYEQVTGGKGNHWAEPGSPEAGQYRGLNTTWQTPEGQPFEVQFHTADSYAVKTENHPLYKEYGDANTTPERAQELDEAMTKRFDLVPVPPGALDIR